VQYTSSIKSYACWLREKMCKCIHFLVIHIFGFDGDSYVHLSPVLGCCHCVQHGLKQPCFWQFPLPWFYLPKMGTSSSQPHHHMSECLYNSITFWLISLQPWKGRHTVHLKHHPLTSVTSTQWHIHQLLNSVAKFFTINYLFQLFTSLKYGILITFIVDIIIY
jgi:hypothetical protein